MSDLLEHDPERFSLYVSDADCTAWVQTLPTSPPDFSRVDLRIVPINRPDHAALRGAGAGSFLVGILRCGESTICEHWSGGLKLLPLPTADSR